jgi:hypothetical protein
MREYSWKSATETILGVLTESRGFVSGLVLNFALIVGVIVFEWGLVEIAVTYFIEIAVIHFFFLIVALFTPQLADEYDGDVWDTEPTPFQPISLFPPVYWRNIKLVRYKLTFTGVLTVALIMTIFLNSELVSTLPLSVGIAIVGIVLFQLMRVWRYFIADRSYRDKSPQDAIQFAFAPVGELLFIIFYAFIPVTFVIVGSTIAIDADIPSRLVLLLVYLVPIGVIRAWMRSLDPRTDDLEIRFG